MSDAATISGYAPAAIATRNGYAIAAIASVSGAAIPVSGSYSAAVLADSPDYYWKLDDGTGTTAADTMENADGTYSHDAVPGYAGLWTQTDAAYIPGHFAEVICGVVGDYRAGHFSVEFWINATSFESDWYAGGCLPFGKGNGADAGYFGVINTDGSMEFRIFPSATTKSVYAPAGSIATGGWHHVVMVQDDAVGYIYVDGADVTSTCDTLANPAYSGIDFTIGNLIYTHLSPTARMAQFALYGHTLIATQVANHYNARNVA